MNCCPKLVRRKNISEHKTQRNGLLHNFLLCLRCRDGKICVTLMGAKAMGQWGNATSMGGNDGVCTKPGGGLKSSLFCWSSLCHLSVRTKRCSIENLLIAYLPFDCTLQCADFFWQADHLILYKRFKFCRIQWWPFLSGSIAFYQLQAKIAIGSWINLSTS